MVKEGQIAPDFTLIDQSWVKRSLKDYRGQWVLLYFYPKDDTPGCTKEACVFRDNFPDFEKIGAAVIGVSRDDVASHKKFAHKYSLPFPILVDSDGSVMEEYGSWGPKRFMGKEYMGALRQSYLIDPEGKIRKIYENVKPEKHAEEVLADLKELQK